MAFDPTLWKRLTFEGVPIYVRPDRPEWFVPNAAGDRLLQALDGPAGPAGDVGARRFYQRLPDAPASEYPGRAAVLRTDHLRELWLHVTDRCNLACRHCLFGSGPAQPAELPAETILDLAAQAADLGARVFALTGGEPFVHRQFAAIVDGLLAHAEANVVILTNGTLLRANAARLRQWPRQRLHLQVSLDGLGQTHDRIRGAGAFQKLTGELAFLRGESIPFTLSMCVHRDSVDEMPAAVDFAAEAGASNVHFMWYFVRGRGDASAWAEPEAIAPRLREAAAWAASAGIGLDNIDALKSQVFAPAGTKHDGGNSGWESLAVGPDGRLYPSAALVGMEALATGIDGDLASAWRTSPALSALRQVSCKDDPSPLRFLIGGGDADHSYAHSGEFLGGDPYRGVYESTALWLIAREAARQDDAGPPRLRLKMGDVLESCGAHGSVALTHTNCLLALAEVDGRTAVKQYYTAAVHAPREHILNPAGYPPELLDHVPQASRVRSYGCGSPVLDAALQAGERVVDLGSGSGVECFIAARIVGREGSVTGVDMLQPMLDLAEKGAGGVAEALGYRNLQFRKGYLEALPLEDASADVVISNCVLNLSTHKRRTFAEVLRVLRPGGRLVVADVVCETEPDPAVRNDDVLRGECIAGALTQRDLFALLEESGFVRMRVIRRVPYRVVGGHSFFSMTFQACRPGAGTPTRAMYRGPFAAVITHGGTLLPAGQTRTVWADEVDFSDGEVFQFDAAGAVTNVDVGEACNCGCLVPPDEGGAVSLADVKVAPAPQDREREAP